MFLHSAPVNAESEINPYRAQLQVSANHRASKEGTVSDIKSGISPQ